jgi:hypothetical protein
VLAGEARAQTKWGPASLPAPTAPSEGSAKFPEPGPRGTQFTNFGSPAQASLPTGNSLQRRSPATSTPVRQPKPRFCFVPPGLTRKSKPAWCSAALLGMTLNLRPALPPSTRRPLEAASRCRKIISSGASSRLAPKSPRGASHCLPRRSDLWSPAAPFPRCRFFDEAGTAAPITRQTLNPISESHQAKKMGARLWITWISGKRAGTFFDQSNGPFAGCRSVLPGLPRPSA